MNSRLARQHPQGRGSWVQRKPAELRRRESLRPAAAASTLLVMALVLGACADSDSSALPRGDGTTTGVTSSSEPATESTDSPSPTESGWESNFTQDQLAEYDEALARWEDYERKSEPLWADPKPTDESLKLFRSFFYAPNALQDQLATYAQVDIKISGLPTVLWSKATRIEGSAVTIRQCIDLSTQVVTQYGEPTKGRPKKPKLRDVSISRPDAKSEYLISNIDRDVRGAERCSDA